MAERLCRGLGRRGHAERGGTGSRRTRRGRRGRAAREGGGVGGQGSRTPDPKDAKGGPGHHPRAASARKCPSLVSDVLLSHGLLRSTIGARGLNFRVRNGTGCTSPAMVADQRGAFGCKGPGLARCPGGRTAQRVLGQKVARTRLLRVGEEELGLLVQLG